MRLGFFLPYAFFGSKLTISHFRRISLSTSLVVRESMTSFAIIAGLNCAETSRFKFKGSQRWMAPELLNIDTEGKSGLPTCKSDVFALGMVTFEVRNSYRGKKAVS